MNSKPLREDQEVTDYSGFQDVLVFPATTRMAMEPRGDIEDLFPHTTSFSQFLVQDVFQCNVGDPSAPALAT
jgi:hypothetical protein